MVCDPNCIIINGGYMKIGIDIGGNHIGIGLVNELGNIIIKKEKDLVKDTEENIHFNIVNTIITYIDEIMLKSNTDITKIKYIGIAFPANLQNGIVGKAVNLGINGDEIKKEIQNKVHLPVYIKNDAKCAAICEKKYGNLKKYSNAIFLSLGTGIGGAVFINNTLIETTKNDLFEVGHMIIQKDGIECNCGKKGCFEKYASITALKREVKDKYNIKKELTGMELHDFIAINLQDEKMEKIIEEYIENLSIGISNIITLFEPEVIVIGGSFSYYKDIFLEKLENKLQENHKAFRDNLPKILIAHHKNDAGIIGAANII